MGCVCEVTDEQLKELGVTKLEIGQICIHCARMLSDVSHWNDRNALDPWNNSSHWSNWNAFDPRNNSVA